YPIMPTTRKPPATEEVNAGRLDDLRDKQRLQVSCASYARYNKNKYEKSCGKKNKKAKTLE
ncbi:hypothetical protein Tco_0584614, partial [Tanacetum coccineum]